MNTQHLSEMDIQQYAADKANCGADMILHVESCEKCRAAAAVYRQLFAAVREQPPAAFDFDLPALVVSRLPAARPPSPAGSRLLYLLAIAVLGCIGIPLYLFRETLLKMYAGILPMAIYLIILPIAVIFIFQCLELYRNHQKRMDALNY